MLILLVPAVTPEISWVCDVLFKTFLGLDYTLRQGPPRQYRLQCGAGWIDMPDVFFDQVYRHTAGAAAQVRLPLPLWDPRSAGLDAVLCARTVPVIFGESVPQAHSTGGIRLPLDIIGSAFFMLSRYEELDSLAQDEHGRFPDQAALAVRAGFQQRPIIDEYTEILWAAIQKTCPDIQRAVRVTRTLISCDVDLPVDPACASVYRLVKRMVGRSLRHGTARGISTLVGNYMAVRRGEHGRDPYLQALDWIMEINSHEGNRVAFNLIPAVTDPTIDQSIDLYDARLLDLMRTVHARGHEIGIHPGYNTYHHPNAMSRSVARLRAAMSQLGISQPILGGRQHYLRWRVHVTPQLWEENALDYDSSLGYAGRPGFRCGTCREFAMFDLVGRHAMHLRQRPLLSMEPMRYRSAPWSSGAVEAVTHYRQLCRRYGGDFTLLWHNSNLDHPRERGVYRDILAA
jgi:peptidoglycan/xylan/chitin deacetylase (PgdA/CDA1 family)